METITFKLIGAGFILLTFLCLAAITFAIRKAGQNPMKTLLVTGLWLLSISIFALLGFFANFNTVPPRMFIVLVLPIIGLIILLRNKKFIQLLGKIPLSWPIWIQSFRIGVEILLWQLLVAQVLPEQMTFEGRNWDILVGLTAPLFAYFFKNNPRVLLIWNIFGLVLLTNIVTTAILSMPTPFRMFMNEPANTIVAHFPIIWLPGFLVPLAYYMHFISIQQILLRLRMKNAAVGPTASAQAGKVYTNRT